MSNNDSAGSRLLTDELIKRHHPEKADTGTPTTPATAAVTLDPVIVAFSNLSAARPRRSPAWRARPTRRRAASAMLRPARGRRERARVPAAA
jgi:hypothetical protein